MLNLQNGWVAREVLLTSWKSRRASLCANTARTLESGSLVVGTCIQIEFLIRG